MRLVLILFATAIIVTIGFAVITPRSDVARLAQSSDVERGAKIFRRCQACHALEINKKLSGPSLANVINRPSGALSGYRYSAPMAKRDVVWDTATLTLFLTKPREFVPGTKMGFAGISDPDEVVDLLAFLTAKAGVYTAPSQ